MKKAIFILFTFISLSIYSQQTVFEKTLGKENVETLNFLIENFETKTLKKEYPNLTTENSYKEFLKDNSIYKRKTFVESKLKLNIYCVRDSIWIKKRTLSSGKESDMIVTRYKCLKQNNEVVYNKSIHHCCSDRSKTLSFIEKDKRIVQINLIGSYIKAFEKISNKSNFLNLYLEHIKMTATPMLPPLMANYILKNNINTNDYFVKRIMYINQIYR